MRAGAVLRVTVVPSEQIRTPLGFLALGPGMREGGVLKVIGVPGEEVMTPGKFFAGATDARWRRAEGYSATWVIGAWE